MKYPLRTDYNIPINHIDRFIYDPIIKQGNPVMDKTGIDPYRVAGGYGVVFKIQAGTDYYALKCWTADLGNLKNCYEEIDKYLKIVCLPYFVDFSYLKEGIYVNGVKYPTLRMGWAEGLTLKDFIGNHKNEPELLLRVAGEFLEMVTALHKNQIAHGDLQHGNIILNSTGSKIYLIDYDDLCVPALLGEQRVIQGLPGYQHPLRLKDNTLNLGLKADYFSELVIYLSLLAIAENSQLWEAVKDTETLLFSNADFEFPENSAVFKTLLTMSSDIKCLTGKLKEFCVETDLNHLFPLEEYVEIIEADEEQEGSYSGGAWNFTNANKQNDTKQAKVKIKLPKRPNNMVEDDLRAKLDVTEWNLQQANKKLSKQQEEIISKESEISKLHNKSMSFKFIILFCLYILCMCGGCYIYYLKSDLHSAEENLKTVNGDLASARKELENTRTELQNRITYLQNAKNDLETSKPKTYVTKKNTSLYYLDANDHFKPLDLYFKKGSMVIVYLEYKGYMLTNSGYINKNDL
ncbi:MAG: hypothetical protein LBN93_07570 [Candidatus Symbiothrix sp.]|jgi:serine/threonine protein kinase|nr:hypothetical protein [Candidatus Symbiothrix sp.]